MHINNPIFSLKNFRSFGEKGANFELAPMTVLTGCNSAGKSSLVKALLLLGYHSKGGVSSSLAGTRILPSMYLKASSVDLKLGGYRNVVHDMNKDGIIELTYNIWSSFLQEEVICKRVYHERKGILNDGELSSLLIEKKDGTIVYRAFIDDINGDYFVRDEINSDAISINYERFAIAYRYVFPKFLSTFKGGKRDDNSHLQNKIITRAKEGEEKLSQHGMTINEAEEYNIDTFQHWRAFLQDNDHFLQEFKDGMSAVEKKNLEKLAYENCVINEIVFPWFISRLNYIDSSTNKISRIYNVEDKDKLSVLLCDIVNRNGSEKYRTGDFVDKWLQTFGIGDSLEIEGTDEGLGVRIYVNKKGERRLLADEGCGLTQIVSILLQIDRLKKLNSYEKYDPESNEEFDAYHDSFISVEEPEVHLHPKYQSLLADMFVEAYQKYNIHFIIETHSEYLIRKLQVLVADKENKLTANDVSLNYVEKDENGVSTNRKIEILEDGSLNGTFGSGFYDEADTLALNLFRKKVILS